MTSDLTVIYNDTCPICAREVMAYKLRTGLDVTYVGLSEGKHADFGLDDVQAAKQFHVFQGSVRLDGVDAFAVLWDRIDGLKWLAKAVRLPVVATLAKLGYRWVAAPALYALHKRRVKQGCAVRLG